MPPSRGGSGTYPFYQFLPILPIFDQAHFPPAFRPSGATSETISTYLHSTPLRTDIPMIFAGNHNSRQFF